MNLQEFLKVLGKFAEKSETPWTEFQAKRPGEDWLDIESFDVIRADMEFRRIPSAINFRGFEFDAPVSHPLVSDEIYFTPNIHDVNRPGLWKWYGSVGDNERLQQEIIHLTSESAINHAKAMLAIAEKKPKVKPTPDGSPSPTEP